MMGLIPILLSAGLLTQIPNPVPALNAARGAKASVEAAQKKNAEALDPAPRAPAAPPQATPPAQPPAGQTVGPTAGKPAAEGQGYTYNAAGRRNPFVSLTGRGSDVPLPGGSRPQGLAGLLVNEATVKGVLRSAKGDFLALLQAPDNRTYIARAGDKVLDGSIKTITQDAVVFSQDVNDPLSLVKQREVRKPIRPEAR